MAKKDDFRKLVERAKKEDKAKLDACAIVRSRGYGPVGIAAHIRQEWRLVGAGKVDAERDESAKLVGAGKVDDKRDEPPKLVGVLKVDDKRDESAKQLVDAATGLLTTSGVIAGLVLSVAVPLNFATITPNNATQVKIQMSDDCVTALHFVFYILITLTTVCAIFIVAFGGRTYVQLTNWMVDTNSQIWYLLEMDETRGNVLSLMMPTLLFLLALCVLVGATLAQGVILGIVAFFITAAGVGVYLWFDFRSFRQCSEKLVEVMLDLPDPQTDSQPTPATGEKHVTSPVSGDAQQDGPSTTMAGVPPEARASSMRDAEDTMPCTQKDEQSTTAMGRKPSKVRKGKSKISGFTDGD